MMHWKEYRKKNKSENCQLINYVESGIAIFSCTSNLECLAKNVQDVFVDGTFKCCPKYFFQMYKCTDVQMEIMCLCYMHVHCYREKVKYATDRYGF